VTIRIRKIAPEEVPRREEWAEALAALDSKQAKVLKRDQGTAVYSAELAGRRTVAKRWTLDSASRRLKSLAAASRAWRHWRGATQLVRLGIPTAKPYLLAVEHIGQGRSEWLVMEALDGHTILDCLAAGDLPIREQHRIARLLGEQVALFQSNSIFNRDHKPSNLFLLHGASGPRIAVIDTVAIRRGADPQRMLASLAIEPLGCGIQIRAALAMRVVSAYIDAMNPGDKGGDPEIRDLLWHRVRQRIARHGDPTPKVNPLPPIAKLAPGKDLR
jgi:tRNA A-37 threonylcarbamoyl transferase component Bud32